MSDIVRVVVKCNKTIYPDVKLDLRESLSVFKNTIWSLSKIPPDRQTIIIQRLVKDDQNLKELSIKDGQKVLVVGSPEDEVIPSAPPPRPPQEVAKEQPAEDKLESSHFALVGLANSGNLCYFNSCVQFLMPVKPLRELLEGISLEESHESGQLLMFYTTLSKLYNNLAAHSTALNDRAQFNFLRTFEEFDKKDQWTGRRIQQDAEQCLRAILVGLSSLRSQEVQKVFACRVVSSSKCEEAEDEAATIANEPDLLILPCHLGEEPSLVMSLAEGIKRSLEDVITKFSPSLQRDATYKKTMTLSQVPQFLITQFLRFEWKQLGSTSATPGRRAKVCRGIQFSKTLDVSEFCDETLKKEFILARDILSDRPIHTVSETEKKDEEAGKSADSPLSNAQEECEKKRELQTGFYKLQAVLTHQGREAMGGHYVTWVVHQEKGLIIEYNDDKVETHRAADVDLTGGRSDYHIAYLCLFEKETVLVTEEEISQQKIKNAPVST